VQRLIVDGWGKFLGADHDQIVVKEKGSVVYRCLPRDLRQVIFSGKGSLSTDAIELLAAHGVDIVFLDWKGEVRVHFFPPELRTVSTRKEQYAAYNDRRGVALAVEFVTAKVNNQRAVLGSLAKRRVDTDPCVAEALYAARESIGEIVPFQTDASHIEHVRDELMAYEANAAKLYWGTLTTLFAGWQFTARSGRYATDPINAMLNYGYAMLRGEVERCLHFAGLDLHGGFLHADRPGRTSLALDLMEEFRQHIVDKTVFNAVTRNMLERSEFDLVEGIARMHDRARKLLQTRIGSRMEEYVRIGDERILWCNIILRQAHAIAKFVRGEGDYRGFWMRW
jgi:CRISPR-associated protein Cas1